MKTCSKCGGLRDRQGQRYCRACHAGYIRDYRESSAEARFRDTARSAVSNAIRDGRLTRQACRVCGDPNAEAHHPDYSKPLDVVWLCVPHHGVEHRRLKEIENVELLQATG